MVVGRACLLLVFIASLWAIGAGTAGGRLGRDELVESARRGIYAVLAMAVIAMAILEAAYVRSDFRYAQGDGPIGRFFNGEATSEVGLRQSAGRDLWVAMQPDTSVLRGAIAEANRRFGTARPELQAIVIAAIAQRWVAQSPPASFRLIVRTGVSWMWLGALIVGAGALVALWPRGAARRRAVTRSSPSTILSAAIATGDTPDAAGAELEASR